MVAARASKKSLAISQMLHELLPDTNPAHENEDETEANVNGREQDE